MAAQKRQELVMSKEARNASKAIYNSKVGDTEGNYWFQDPSMIGIPNPSGKDVDPDNFQPFLQVFSKFNPLDEGLFVLMSAYMTFIKFKQLDLGDVKNRIHWLTGINSDLHELETALEEFHEGTAPDMVNYVEEIGDILFFTISYAYMYGLHFSVVADIIRSMTKPATNVSNKLTDELFTRVLSSINTSFREVADLCDVEKGRMTSDKPFNILDVKTKLSSLVTVIVRCMQYIDPNPKTANGTILLVIESNKKKLGFRYAGSFTASEDINRDMDIEAEGVGELIEDLKNNG